jgi:hypothetical protein
MTSDRHDQAPDKTRLTMVDGRDALAFVIVRPGPDGGVTVEATSKGLSKPAAAEVLRHVANMWDAEEDGQPAPATPEPPSTPGDNTRDLPLRHAHRLAEARAGLGGAHPAGLDTLLDHVGARIPEDQPPIVAYRSKGGRLLRCLDHHPGQQALDSGDFLAITAADLPEGGTCTKPLAIDKRCGVNVVSAGQQP